MELNNWIYVILILSHILFDSTASKIWMVWYKEKEISIWNEKFQVSDLTMTVITNATFDKLHTSLGLWGTYVYLWLTHVAIWQKTTKFCKAVIVQLKKQRQNPKTTVCDSERGYDESFQSQKAVWNLLLFLHIKIRKILEDILGPIVHQTMVYPLGWADWPYVPTGLWMPSHDCDLLWFSMSSIYQI